MILVGYFQEPQVLEIVLISVNPIQIIQTLISKISLITNLLIVCKIYLIISKIVIVSHNE